MLAAAVEAATSLPKAPRLLAVTVLTSMDSTQLSAIGVISDPAHQVLYLGKMAQESGITGLVCSPQEVSHLRADLGQEIALVVPGIRSSTDAIDDQARTASASDTLRSGASMLVVGRPITRAADPRIAAQEILSQMNQALAESSSNHK